MVDQGQFKIAHVILVIAQAFELQCNDVTERILFDADVQAIDDFAAGCGGRAAGRKEHPIGDTRALEIGVGSLADAIHGEQSRQRRIKIGIGGRHQVIRIRCVVATSVTAVAVLLLAALGGEGRVHGDGEYQRGNDQFQSVLRFHVVSSLLDLVAPIARG